MALSQDMDARLLALPWRCLQIGDCSFFSKVHFSDSGYCLLLSDLSSMWCEEAGADVVAERSKEQNKRLKCPVSSFLTHLSQLILPLLDSMNNDSGRFSCHRTERTLTLRVKSQLFGLPFYWNFHCQEAGISTVCRHFLRPLISMTKALDSQCHELCVRLGRKDAEIQDYQESGAALSRARLKTEPFDEESFHQSFLTENVQNRRDSENAPGFSDRLQRLYSAVIEAEMPQNPEAPGVSEKAESPPKPPSVGEDSAGLTVNEPSTTQEDVDTGHGQKSSQVPPADVPSMTQCPPITVSKAKKRKAKGLFT